MIWFLRMAIKVNIAVDKLKDGEKGLLISLGMACAVCVPMWIVYASLYFGNSSQSGIFATIMSNLFVISATIVAIFISIFVGGVSRAALSSMSSNGVVTINLVTSVGIAAAVSITLREAVKVIGNLGTFSDIIVIIFVGVWSTMSLNMLKTPWDDLRDRIANANSPEKL